MEQYIRVVQTLPKPLCVWVGARKHWVQCSCRPQLLCKVFICLFPDLRNLQPESDVCESDVSDSKALPIKVAPSLIQAHLAVMKFSS